MYAVSGGLAFFVLDNNKWYETILLIGGGLAMIVPGTVTDLTGLAVVALIIVLQYFRAKKKKLAKAAA